LLLRYLNLNSNTECWPIKRLDIDWTARGSNPGWGTHTVSCTMGTGSFPEVKRPGRGVDLPPLSSAEVKERVDLYC